MKLWTYTTKIILTFSLLAVLSFGVCIRLYDLETFPRGIHGDEGWTGMRAKVIQEHGWIGFFDPIHSVGQWALPEYAAALFLTPSEPVRSLRVATAYAGILSLFFFAIASWIGTRQLSSTIVGTLLLTLSFDHLLLSSVALPPMFGFACYSLVLIFILQAFLTRSLLYILLAGLSLTIGTISYGGFVSFVVTTFAGFFLFWPEGWLRKIKNTLLLGFVYVSSLSPVLYYEWNNGSLQTRMHAALESNNGGDKLKLILSQVSRMLSYFINPSQDGSDGSGAFPLLGIPLIIAIVLSTILCFSLRKREHRNFTWFCLCSIFIGIGLSVFISADFGYGFNRRVMPILLPCLLLIAFGLAAPIVHTYQKMLHGVVVALTLWVAGVWFYQIENRSSDIEIIRFTYVQELTEAIQWMSSLLPQTPTVAILASGRWDGNYETSRYLLDIASQKVVFRDFDKGDFSDLLTLVHQEPYPQFILVMPEFFQRFGSDFDALPCATVIKTRNFWGCKMKTEAGSSLP